MRITVYTPRNSWATFTGKLYFRTNRPNTFIWADFDPYTDFPTGLCSISDIPLCCIEQAVMIPAKTECRITCEAQKRGVELINIERATIDET